MDGITSHPPPWKWAAEKTCAAKGDDACAPRHEGLPAAVFLVEVRQDVFAHQFDHFELFVVLHPGPADPEDEEVTIEASDAPFELFDDVLGAPEDEAVARQLLEADAK